MVADLYVHLIEKCCLAFLLKNQVVLSTKLVIPSLKIKHFGTLTMCEENCYNGLESKGLMTEPTYDWLFVRCHMLSRDEPCSSEVKVLV